METSTFSNSSCDKLTIKDVKRAIKLLDNLKPCVVKSFVNNKEDLEPIKRLALASEIGVQYLYGFPVIIDESIPEGYMKFQFSDGHTEIIKIVNDKK